MPPVKLACLACRTSRTRCDGEQPCYNCISRKQDCLYQSSRRGGSRRGSSKKLSVFPPNAGIVHQDRTRGLDQIKHLLDVDAGSRYRRELSSTPYLPENADTCKLRTYSDNKSLLNAYYLYIHPFFPILPPPIEATDADTPVSWTPKGHDDLPSPNQQSPLVLAISMILLLVELPANKPQDQQASNNLRSHIAHNIARRTLDQVESLVGEETHRDIDRSSGSINHTPVVRSLFHPRLPTELESIIALVILGNYEHIQRGNMVKMSSRIGQAIVSARGLSLHQQPQVDDEFAEARRRAWWMAYAQAKLCFLVSGDISLGAGEEVNISTPYPQLEYDHEIWPLYITSLRLSTLAKDASDPLKLSQKSQDQVSEAYHQALQIDREIQSLLPNLKTTTNNMFLVSGSESISAQVLRGLCRIKLASARIRIHRRHAFADIAILTQGHCDIASSEKNMDVQQIELITTPFDHVDSAATCTDAALIISRQLKQISTLTFVDSNHQIPCTMPISTCCAMQASYSLLMQFYCTRIQLQDESGNLCARTDPERFEEELRHGLHIILGSLKAQAKMFDTIRAIKEEVEMLIQTLS